MTTPIDETTDGRCESALNIEGGWFRCELASDHARWVHRNQEAGAIWGTPDKDRKPEEDRKIYLVSVVDPRGETIFYGTVDAMTMQLHRGKPGSAHISATHVSASLTQ